MSILDWFNKKTTPISVKDMKRFQKLNTPSKKERQRIANRLFRQRQADKLNEMAACKIRLEELKEAKLLIENLIEHEKKELRKLK